MASQVFRRLVHALRQVLPGTGYESRVANASRQEEDRRALEELGLLTASLEHNLRNPLIVMGSAIFDMHRKYDHDERIKRFLDELDDQLRRLEHSLDVVHLFRGNTTHFSRFMKKVAGVDLINRAIKNLKRELRVSDSIMFRLDHDRRVFLKADPRSLEQAILCILKNAIEAIQETERSRGLVSIRLLKREDMAEIQIIDDGCGIPEHNVPQLGKMFSSKEYGSINRGLGLSMATRILHVHNGQLKIASEVGKGTTVTLILPTWTD